MEVIPEMCRAHLIWYLRFFDYMLCFISCFR